jgi:hypothetical protein
MMETKRRTNNRYDVNERKNKHWISWKRKEERTIDIMEMKGRTNNQYNPKVRSMQ